MLRLVLALLLAPSVALAQTVPAVNSTMTGCVDGAHVVYQSGAVRCGGASPTMGTCGTTPSVSGDDRSGVITVGSGVVTACTLNFSATLAYTPNCVAVPNTVLAVGVTAISTSAVTFSVLSTIGGGKLYYFCPRGA